MMWTTPVEYVSPDEQQLTELETLLDVTQDGTMLKETYDYQGELYEVTESSEIHSKLQADKNFFAEFFQKGIERNIVQDNLGESYCSQINPDYTMPAQEDLNETPNDDENDSKFGWDHRSILFLLSKYSEWLAKFRNPKIKKITLWREIEKEFHIIGISQVNAQMIDHKFRNLKATYKNIKNNNKKTGRGRQPWEWYQQMAEILENDKSVNFDTGIASMDDGAINLSQRRITSAHRLSLTSMSSFQNCYDNYDFTHIRSLSSSSNAFFLSHILSLSSSFDAFSDSDEEASADTPSNSNHLDAGDSSNSSHLDAGDSSNSSHLNAGDCNCSLMPNGEPVSPGSAQSLTFSIPSEEI